MGELEGTLAAGLSEALPQSVAWSGMSDAPIIMSGAEVARLDEVAIRGLRATLENRKPILLVQADAVQINGLMGLLGLEQNIALPEGVTHAEVYGVDFEPNGDEYILESFPPAAVDSAVWSDDARNQRERADDCIDWLEEDERRQPALAEQPGPDDLRQLAQAHIVAQNFYFMRCHWQMNYAMYSCHTFDAVDATDTDWFYIEQSCTINTANAYQGFHHWYGGGPRDGVGYYLAKCDFNSELALPTSAAVLAHTSPPNASRTTRVTSGVNFRLGGKVGLKDKNKLSAILNLGVSIRHSESFDVTDCEVINDSLRLFHNAEWLYRPKNVVADHKFQYAGLTEPATLSITSFHPRHLWVWKVSRSGRDSPQGQEIHVGMDTILRHAEGGRIKLPWWHDPPDYKEQSAQWRTRVPLFYPPVLVAPANLSFRAGGDFRQVELATSRAWTAASNQAWCTVDPGSGPTTSSKFIVTVQPNQTGADRLATVSVRTADGKEESPIQVFQARN